MNFCIPPDEDFKLADVLPYIGPEYGSPHRWGVTILILGESHYAEDMEAGEPLGTEFTRGVIQEVLNGIRKPAFNFFAKVAGLFYGGRHASEAERIEFWHSVAYYSFVQACVGNSPRRRPTSLMWERAELPFVETLQLLDPELVLVLGRELWVHLPALNSGETDIQLGGERMSARFYARRTGRALAFAINHPSSIGWSYRKWAPWTVQAARQARQHMLR